MLFTVQAQGPKPVELIIVRAVGAFQMRIYFRMYFVVLDQETAKSRNQFTQFSDLHSRFSAEFFAVVDREYGFQDSDGFQSSGYWIPANSISRSTNFSYPYPIKCILGMRAAPGRLGGHELIPSPKMTVFALLARNAGLMCG